MAVLLLLLAFASDRTQASPGHLVHDFYKYFPPHHQPILPQHLETLSYQIVSDAAVNSTTTSAVASWNVRKLRGEVWTDGRGRFTTILPPRQGKPPLFSSHLLPFGPKSVSDSDNEGLLNVKSVYKVLRMWWEPAKAQELQEIAKITTISNVSMQTGDIIFKTAHLIPLHFHFKQTEPKKNSDYLK